MLLALREKSSVTLTPLSSPSASTQAGVRVIPGEWASTFFSPCGTRMLLLEPNRAHLLRVAAPVTASETPAAPAEGAPPSDEGIDLCDGGSGGAVAGEGLLAAAFSPKGTYVQVLRKARAGGDERACPWKE